MENKETKPVVRHELFDFIRKNPQVLDAHARWLASGGEKLLELAVNSARGDMFPWDKPLTTQASFGAFVGGISWLSRMMRGLVEMTNNRHEALRMLAQADGQISEDERRILRDSYGYTDEEIDAVEKKPRARKLPAIK